MSNFPCVTPFFLRSTWSTSLLAWPMTTSATLTGTLTYRRYVRLFFSVTYFHHPLHKFLVVCFDVCGTCLCARMTFEILAHGVYFMDMVFLRETKYQVSLLILSSVTDKKCIASCLCFIWMTLLIHALWQHQYVLQININILLTC